MHFRTRAIHVGNEKDEATGAIVRPIHLASTYVQHHAGEWRDFDYSRSGNPTRKAVEETIASLESGTHALCFASGMAATHAATMLLQSGDHILAGSDIYGGTYRLMHKITNRSNVAVTLSDTRDLTSFEKAVQPNTKLIWIESPGNPLMSITDIAACAEIAKRHNVLLGVDSTFASPVFTRPLELGADIVMHSATKYLGGHSDLLAGVLVVRDKILFDELYFIQNSTGAVTSPLDSFLLGRGLKTLDLRMRAQSDAAMEIAKTLQSDPRIKRVLYPGLPAHPGHDIATRQMDGGFGAMMSFEMNGTYEQTKHFVESTRLFQLAVSLGAVESLIEQPASMSHASYDAADRAKFGITDGLVRISIGLEDVSDLTDDLLQALDAVVGENE